MSLINKMLRDLDKRHAPQVGMATPAAEALAGHVRPVPSTKLASEFFWRTMAMAMLFSIGWVAWLVWQLTPRPVVTELAYQAAKGKVTAPADASSAPADAAAPAAKAAPAAAPPATTAPADPVAVAATPAAQTAPAPTAEKVNFDMLRLATQLTTPIPERRSLLARTEPKKSAKSATTRPPARPVDASATLESGKIERRSNTTANERAENEFRRAVNLVNQGRIAEGMDGFRSALKIDPAHEAARQTLVALLLEAKRVDEAAVVLQEGLASVPENTAFGMLLARIMVERDDIPAALALLQKHAAPPDRNPDFHAFAGALYQRLDRHREAIEQYQSALRLAPSAGIWWIGLGISFQAVARRKDALEAFTRAKSAGTLAPDLLAFVDQRLRQLQ